jgi:hypothetical protein
MREKFLGRLIARQAKLAPRKVKRQPRQERNKTIYNNNNNNNNTS